MTKRGRFLALVGGAVGSSLLLAGCLGNPPGPAGSGSGTPTTPTTGASASNANLEVKTISLGYVPILEAAPLVIGLEKGYFARHGLDVKLSPTARRYRCTCWPC